MAKYEDPNQLDYRNGGDTVDDFAQKYMRTIAYVFKALNDLRTPTGNTAGVDPEPYMWRIADNKLYIRNADNTDYILLGDISPNFGFRQSVNDRFLTTADLEGEGAVVTRNEAGKVEGDITGSPGKIANKTIDVTPTADNDVIAYDATQQKWVKKTLNDYLKKQGDAGWDEMVDEVADQVIEDITPIIFNFWYLDDDDYLVPLVGSTEGGLPSIHGMVGDYEQITARSVDVAGNVSATGNVTAGMVTTPQANVNSLTANAVNAQSASVTEISAGTLTANDVISRNPADRVYNVRNYDIYPDGTDISTKLNNLIASVHEDGGGTIQFNDGTYVVDVHLDSGTPKNHVIFLSNVYFRGTGSTTITSGGKEFYTLFRELGYGHETNNVRFYGITFDCYLDSVPSTAGNKYRCAILAQRVSNMVVENCRFIFNSINAVDFSTGDSIQDIIDHKNSGNYYVHDITFRNNRFIFKIASNLAYYDNNAISLCGKNIYILGNRFDVDILTDTYNVIPNAAVRMDGENIVVSGNIINGWANAADMDIVDERGDVRRNYIFENNICNTYRGIWLWARPGKILRGAYIRNNIFTQAFSSYAHVAGGAGAGTSAVGLASHNTDSYNGYYKDIQITDNVVDYTSAISFMSGLSQATYEATSYFINVGTPFEAAFAAFNLAGSSNGRQEVIVKRNMIKNSVFPAVYVGGKSTSLGYEIDGNTFIDCDYGSNHSIVALRDYVVGVSVKNNNIIDSGNPSHGNTFIACGAGQYKNASQARIFELMAKNNNVLTINPASVFDNNYTAVMWPTCDVDDVHITGTGAAPTWIPYKIGQTVFDTASGKLYFAAGTTAVSDWKEIALN